MNRILALILIMLIIIPYQSSAGELTDEDHQISAIQTAMDSTVSVVVTSNQNIANVDLDLPSGSGFFVAPNTILTNAHVVVVAGVTGVSIQKFDDEYSGKKCDAKVGWRDEELDLALLTTSCEGRPLELANKITIGQDIFVTGNPLSLDWIATKGIVARDVDYQGVHKLILDVGATHGNSGSPVVDSKGQVIGVISNSVKDTPYLVMAIHLIDVKAFLNRAGVS